MARMIKICSLDSNDELVALSDWTLTKYKVSIPEYKSSFVSVPGRDGDLDLSTALTDGEPRFKNRILTATLEYSAWDFSYRENRLASYVAALQGKKVRIRRPTSTSNDYYYLGRCSCEIPFSDKSHCALSLTVNCDPWLYKWNPTTSTKSLSSTASDWSIANSGKRKVVPTFTVSSSATIVYNSHTWTLSAGTYKLPDIVLASGTTTLSVKGSGTITATYQEAVML